MSGIKLFGKGRKPSPIRTTILTGNSHVFSAGASDNIHRKRLGFLFLTVSCLAANAVASDFSSYSTGKGIYYDQTAGGTPVMKSPYPYWFHAQVVSLAPFLTVSVTGPTNSSSAELSGPHSSPGLLEGWVRHTNQASLDSRFLNGNYAFDIFSFIHGHQFVTNTLATGSFPNAPMVSNLTAAQSVDAASDFTLTWNPFSGGTTNDFISCQLQGVNSNYFTSPAFGTAGALDGTATSVLIPAGTLLPGHAYLGRLTFAFTQAVVSNS